MLKALIFDPNIKKVLNIGFKDICEIIIGENEIEYSTLEDNHKENYIKTIDIPEDEYFRSKTLAVNILALSPRNLVVMKGYPKTIDLLINSGCKINLFSGDELCIKTEGGATCLTRPIWRE